MPWNILEKLWKRTLNPSGSSNADSQTWDLEIKTLYQQGISMENALQFLYIEKPDFELFKTWIKNNSLADKNSEFESLKDNVLSEQDLEFWKNNGYIIIKNAISKEDCKNTQQAIWDFLNMDFNKRETWYQEHPNKKGLMVNFSNHETLNKNRYSPKIKKAYEQLYGSTKIYKSIDKVSFNPPETENSFFLGSPLHWDISLKQPFKFGLQGLLYLTDCGINDGAFHCVPGFHNKIDNWLDNLEPHENPREIALQKLQPEPIIGNAGDFIIWDNTLPHCASPNKGESPRMVQYLTYLPDDYNTSGEWL